MFIRAGFNRRFRTICAARAKLRGRTFTSYLIMFVPSGDLVWTTPAGLLWSRPWTLDLIGGAPEHCGIRESRLPA